MEPCPNCKALFPPIDGPTHRYIGASAACWAMYSALNAGEPPVASTSYSALMVDAYAAQHYGVPSPQAIQSVAVHLITLYGVLEQGHAFDNVIWLRTRPLRPGKTTKHSRYSWLTPPDFTGSLTVADIVRAPTAVARATVLQQYVEAIWSIWASLHRETISAWYARGVLADEI
ncbi:MAG: DUF5946 family protein [Caldilineaceae bacterium]